MQRFCCLLSRLALLHLNLFAAALVQLYSIKQAQLHGYTGTAMGDAAEAAEMQQQGAAVPAWQPCQSASQVSPTCPATKVANSMFCVLSMDELDTAMLTV